MPAFLLHLTATLLYGGLGVFFWWSYTKQQTARQTMLPAERWLLALALLSHGLALHTSIFHEAQMYFGFGLAVSLMLWLAVVFYWIETLYSQLDGLHPLVLPAGLIGSVIPLLFPAQHVLNNAANPLFRAHFIVAMLAYSLFTLAALHAMLMAIAERQLHRGRIHPIIASLPPLMLMEALLFRLIGIAFVLLTLTLLSGALFSEEMFGQPMQFDHKTIFAVISWALFGILLIGRHQRGWRGRIAIRWTLAGFATLLLAYLGSRFVIEIILQRPF